ncbi:DMT family transporter [Candidatus Sumerlaeota bacterium]|nr:DMT family transporter [Candidatus Sumerlaeota bacterium]
MSDKAGPSTWMKVFLLLCGIVACASASIYIKKSSENDYLLAAWRLLLASILMSPMFFAKLRKHRSWFDRRHLRATMLPGILLGLHFISWIIGLRLTLVANANLIVNMAPVAMPFFLLAVLNEHLNRAEKIGTICAMIGVVCMGFSDYHADMQHLKGDMICFLSMLLFCYYLVLARLNSHFPSVWLYITPLYFVGGVTCLLAGALVGARPMNQPGAESWLALYTPYESTWILLLAVVPTLIGHSLLNYSMKHLRGQTVGVINQSQTIFAGLMAYFFLGEAPRAMLYVAAVFLIGGVVIVVQADRNKNSAQPEEVETA